MRFFESRIEDDSLTIAQLDSGLSLGNFSGIKKPKAEPAKPPEPEVEPIETKPEPVKTAKSEAKVGKKAQKKEQSVTMNIKIKKNQKQWLADTVSTVRDNKTEPVPPSERVYPQHLIGVAIDLLKNVDVNWTEIKNVEELRGQLGI